MTKEEGQRGDAASSADGGRGREPGHAGGLQKLERARNGFSPRASGEDGGPPDTGRPIPDF